MARSRSLTGYFTRLRRPARSAPPAPYPPRPQGTVIWARCCDPDQLSAVENLGRKLAEDGDPFHIVATLPAGAEGCPAPALPEPQGKDNIRRFLAHLRPAIVVWLRGDLDLALLEELRAAQIPRILVDATGEAQGNLLGRWLHGALRAALIQFELVVAVDARAAERLTSQGANPTSLIVLGAMEDSHPVLPCKDDSRNALAAAIGTRPVWFAAAVPQDEWALVAAAHRAASRFTHRLLLIVHPAQAAQAAACRDHMCGAGFTARLRGAMPAPDEATQVYVADTDTAELGLWYRIAPITYLGGSLTGAGCRDPYEPAALGSAVLCGPMLSPHEKHGTRLEAAGGARVLRAPGDLGRMVETLLAPDKAAEVAHAAWDVTSRGAEVTNRIAAFLRQRLE